MVRRRFTSAVGPSSTSSDSSDRPGAIASGALGWLACLWLLCAGCAAYAPTVLDCRITCDLDGRCPTGTSCLEGFCRPPGAVGPCVCRDGEVRPCGSAIGVCREGEQRCTGAVWGACEGGVEPSSESCNGLDDDCDGQIDEEQPNSPPCEKTLGVCAPARKRCVAGAWAACTDADYGPLYEPAESLCDGRDNDCDGVTDPAPGC